MKRILALALCLCTILSLVACSKAEKAEPKTTEAAKTETAEPAKEPVQSGNKKEYPAVTDKLTWDRINAVPVATDDMTEEVPLIVKTLMSQTSASPTTLMLAHSFLLSATRVVCRSGARMLRRLQHLSTTHYSRLWQPICRLFSTATRRARCWYALS